MNHLDFAYNHVSTHWIPVNKSIVDEAIKIATDAGEDAGVRAKDLMRHDVNLYLTLISTWYRQDQTQTESFNSLFSENLGQLIDLLNEIRNTCPNNTARQASHLQLERTEQALLSASSAELLASSSGIDPELGFSCALLRQLGLTLVAWNYPRVYSRAVAKADQDNKLEALLTRQLGFSPTSLGIRLAREWSIAPELRLGMGDATVEASSIVANNKRLKLIGNTLQQICSTSETIATAATPYKNSIKPEEWKKAKEHITQIIGTDGLSLIRERFFKYCDRLEEMVLIIDDIGDSAESKSTKEDTHKEYNNPYVRHCPPLLRAQLRKLYQRLKGTRVSRECLEYLTREIIPSAGFSGGAIYILNSEDISLEKKMSIGKCELDWGAKQYLSDTSKFNPISAAFRLKTPLLERFTPEGEEFPILSITSYIGKTKKAGALYLEVSPRLEYTTKADPLAYFKAIAWALGDCLGLD